ncbi:MAG: CRISPR-associated protein Cas4 [Cyclobacteriaceae bacterium]
MPLTPTHINYYHVCHRKLWLFHHGIRMEHSSDTVTEGRLIHETSYPQRAAKYTELELPGAKIDYFDPKTNTVHEVKKSDKVEEAHIAQVQYYLYLLEEAGIKNPQGLIEYPRLRQREQVHISEEARLSIKKWLADIERIIALAQCPPVINSKICKRCSYYDFCYVAESEE